MTTQADALNRIAKAMEEDLKFRREQPTKYDEILNRITELQLEITDLKQQLKTQYPPEDIQAEIPRTPIQHIGWTSGNGARGPYESQLITEDNQELAGEIESTKGRFNKGGYNYWLGNRDPPRIFRRKQR